MKKINNLPEYAREYKFIVAREVAGEFWFYGAYSENKVAQIAQKEINNGIIFENVRG